jgi:hypothetical protein
MHKSCAQYSVLHFQTDTVHLYKQQHAPCIIADPYNVDFQTLLAYIITYVFSDTPLHSHLDTQLHIYTEYFNQYVHTVNSFTNLIHCFLDTYIHIYTPIHQHIYSLIHTPYFIDTYTGIQVDTYIHIYADTPAYSLIDTPYSIV